MKKKITCHVDLLTFSIFLLRNCGCILSMPVCVWSSSMGVGVSLLFRGKVWVEVLESDFYLPIPPWQRESLTGLTALNSENGWLRKDQQTWVHFDSFLNSQLRNLNNENKNLIILLGKQCFTAWLNELWFVNKSHMLAKHCFNFIVFRPWRNSQTYLLYCNIWDHVKLKHNVGPFGLITKHCSLFDTTSTECFLSFSKTLRKELCLSRIVLWHGQTVKHCL